MEKAEADKFAINLNLLKRCYFYHIINLNGPKFLNRNVYWLIFMVYLAIVMCIFLFGHVGLIRMEDTVDAIDIILIVFTYSACYVCFIKSLVLLYRPDIVWNMLDATRIDFLTSKLCRNNTNSLYDQRERIIKVTDLYYYVLHIVFVQWTLYPCLFNAFDDTTSIHRYQNILNLRFPISVGTYNQYFFIFYFLELIVLYYILYNLISYDILIMSMCWVITHQYKILAKSFADVGYENKPPLGKNIIV